MGINDGVEMFCPFKADWRREREEVEEGSSEVRMEKVFCAFQKVVSPTRRTTRPSQYCTVRVLAELRGEISPPGCRCIVRVSGLK